MKTISHLEENMIEQIPTLDLNDFINNREEFVKKLGTAYMNYGFAGIANHGVTDEIVKQSFDVINRFFQLNESFKKTYQQKGLGGARGYTPFMVEKAKDSNNPDLKEFWHVGRELEANIDYPVGMHPNIWPKEIPEFKETMLNLYQALDNLGKQLLQSIAIFLGLDQFYFDDKVNIGNSILRPIHYPAIESAGNSVRSAQHEDINVITLLVGSQQPGLEVLSKQGNWIPVTSKTGVIVCNIGDMLQRLTNNKLKSTTHRVINPSGDWAKKLRYSIPFFLHFNSDFLIKTLGSCIDANHPNLYEEPILADEYLHQRLVEIGLIQN
jgi:isopenicillin N synthase-like dioxygenase